MKSFDSPFNNSSLNPFNNPKECEKLYLQKDVFFPYVYALKWNYIDVIEYLPKFKLNLFKDFFKVAYLIDNVVGSQDAYTFIKELGQFDSVTYKEFSNLDFLIFLLKIYRDVGDSSDLDFILSIIRQQLDKTLPKTVGEPDIYTHASLHALIVSSLSKHASVKFNSIENRDAVIFSLDNDLVFKNVSGQILDLKIDNNLRIAAMMRIRNEQDNIDFIIKSIDKYVDTIIIYDDCSSDNTVSLIKKFIQDGYNINLIEGSQWLFNESLIHQILIDKGRSIGVTHYVQIDGDEVISPSLTPDLFRKLMSNMEPGDIMALPWLNLTESLDSYYSEELTVGLAPSRGIKRYKDIAFADDGFSQYPEWSYSHVNVAPFTYRRRFMSLSDELALLHLEQLNLINFVAKKDWYRIRAFAQNKKLPADPYLDIRLQMLQLDASVTKLNYKLEVDSSHLEALTKISYDRIQSNFEGCELYPQLKRFMYLDYDYFQTSSNRNISEK